MGAGGQAATPGQRRPPDMQSSPRRTERGIGRERRARPRPYRRVGMTSTSVWARWSLGCRVVTTDRAALAAARATCNRVMDEVEEATSSWRPDSELRQLRPGWNDVSPVLAGAVAASLWAAGVTASAVDPTLGEALARWRDLRDAAWLEPTTASQRLLPPVAHHADWQALELLGRQVWLPEGVSLDLDAVATALAADLAARSAAVRTGAGVLVSLGGHIATAGPGPMAGWQVLVQDRSDDTPLTVTLADAMAIATSSTEHRRLRADQRTSAHLLDPVTLMPVWSPWRTVTVVATTCVAATSYALGAVILGLRAAGLLTAHGLPARLTTVDGRVFELGGFPRQPPT